MVESYFLLEYRDESVSLQYSGDDFFPPKNLWIISGEGVPVTYRRGGRARVP
jgi:hypothetical protein